jgi:hypothetical protein
MDAVVIILIIKTADLVNFLRNSALNRGRQGLKNEKMGIVIKEEES